METFGMSSPQWLAQVKRWLLVLAGTPKYSDLLSKGCGKG